MTYGQCRSCKAQIQWCVSATTGSRIPIDPAPNDDIGNILIDGHGRAFAFRSRPAAIAVRDDHPDSDLGLSGTHVSHFVTCPDRDQHRGKGWASASRQEALL